MRKNAEQKQFCKNTKENKKYAKRCCENALQNIN